MTEQEQNMLPPRRLALIIDEEVVEVLHTDERLAAIFLSEPLVLDVSESVSDANIRELIGKAYNAETKEFTDKPQE
jgi:hypothetical protein